MSCNRTQTQVNYKNTFKFLYRKTGTKADSFFILKRNRHRNGKKIQVLIFKRRKLLRNSTLVAEVTRTHRFFGCFLLCIELNMSNIVGCLLNCLKNEESRIRKTNVTRKNSEKISITKC